MFTNLSTNHDNIALLILQRPVIFDGDVQPACVPSDLAFPSGIGFRSGWVDKIELVIQNRQKN